MKYTNDYTRAILAYAITLFSFTYFFVCLFNNTKPNDAVTIAIVSFMGSVTGYFFFSKQNKDNENKQ